ncbi:PadR family transcriptional regulator [Clostridium sp. SHJSY1]|uniref:PadR family transcriptional regulator n=1 Tax=Clostridium sp. SHJSY1 TaxID=2942483 RepID=UPI002876A9F5|nr:PadR family transcriptional regulator [Clostridium sp. SHJSY1]MDS0525188.1 PadR family transcriptional regulator [Clostridium sp. SHJSY1]
MNNNSQILKGILEGCILSIISKEETYGYELLTKLKKSGFEDIVEGTLYPLLLRLEKNNIIISEKKKSTTGVNRKYYRLSQEGKLELENFISYWKKLYVDVNNIIGGNL